ncbi:hypothetical protein WJX79_010671 [Trebouxia sp. C0005]|nr:MAG: ATP-dependent RNA helicase DHX8 [Trebouxia sp. A1-2]
MALERQANPPSQLQTSLKRQREARKEQDQRKRIRLGIAREELPVWTARQALLQRIRWHDCLVVVGETGSGKTTQIPQLLLKAGLANSGCIACTQPRRVAAITVARRVAQELPCHLGQEVGYSVRFDDKSCASTKIRYMTDGMLLREALRSPSLERYQVIILDEAHERTVQTDVLMGLLKKIKAERGKSLKLIIMSATLDAAAFARYFGGTKTVYIQGRQHPVELLYTALPEDSYLDAALTTVLQIHLEEQAGDILVFLTGQEEIESLQQLLRHRAEQVTANKSNAQQLMVVSLYAAMGADQQLQVFQPAPADTRKVILSTNIAETSVTVPGVRYVVDTGFVKARAYSSKAAAECLQVVPVSQAQARQRAGRAGREAAGKAFRLFTEASFNQLAPTTWPEIQRVNLATVALQLKALGFDDLVGFDFMDRPPTGAMLRALESLYALGALDDSGKLTSVVGKALAGFPVEPWMGKVLLAGAELGCAREALIVVAMAATDPVWLTPRNRKEAAVAAHQQFHSKLGDHITGLNLYRAYEGLQRKQQLAWCQEHFVSARSLQKAVDILQQLHQQLVQLKLPITSAGTEVELVLKALVAGLFTNAARRQLNGTYQVVSTGQPVAMHPSSVLFGKQPSCVVFNEIVWTTQQYMVAVAAVDQQWLREAGSQYFR